MHLKREILLLVCLSNHEGSTDQVLLFNKTIQGQEQHYDEDQVRVSYIFEGCISFLLFYCTIKYFFLDLTVCIKSSTTEGRYYLFHAWQLASIYFLER